MAKVPEEVDHCRDDHNDEDRTEEKVKERIKARVVGKRLGLSFGHGGPPCVGRGSVADGVGGRRPVRSTRLSLKAEKLRVEMETVWEVSRLPDRLTTGRT